MLSLTLPLEADRLLEKTDNVRFLSYQLPVTFLFLPLTNFQATVKYNHIYKPFLVHNALEHCAYYEMALGYDTLAPP